MNWKLIFAIVFLILDILMLGTYYYEFKWFTNSSPEADLPEYSGDKTFTNKPNLIVPEKIDLIEKEKLNIKKELEDFKNDN